MENGNVGICDVKKGKDTWEKYRNVIRVCRDATRRAKIHLNLTPAKDGKENNKSFFKHVTSKKKTRENVGLLLDKVMEDTEKEELLNAFFASVLTPKASPQNPRS